jgi:hypothetical protein
LIQQAVIYNGWKVLLCAPSNIAVDNVSKAMYHGKLVPADSVAQWTLKDLPNITCNSNLSTDDNERINTTLLLIDTAVKYKQI